MRAEKEVILIHPVQVEFIQFQGKWNCKIGAGYYWWMDSNKSDTITKAENRVREINDQRISRAFRKYRRCK